MVRAQRHRGPDASGEYIDPSGHTALGHNRLSIIDLSDAGRQPMCDTDGRLWVVFNGEIYNYLELRRELNEYSYRSRSDTEVLLAAYHRWGDDCLEHFIGMFSFLLWDSKRRRLFAAHDRFGVKPLQYYSRPDGSLMVASETSALHAAGAPAMPDVVAWSTYLTYGLHDHSDRTFWKNIQSLPPGRRLSWEDGQLRVSCWYDLPERVGPEFDRRPLAETQAEYLDVLRQSVALRFRSDVPVGMNLSGGLDSSLLLTLAQAAEPEQSKTAAYTYITGVAQYDELPWVRKMLDHTGHKLEICRLEPAHVPDLADSVQAHESEPFGGLPTLAYARVFERARKAGAIVLLDGQGMDEQWAGYDYYERCGSNGVTGQVQGSRESSVRPECLTPEFRACAVAFEPPKSFPDALRNRQWCDVRYTKLPRALRFNDRISMRSSTELREPFLDHRLFELAFRQPPERKILNGARKWMLRQIARDLVPAGIAEAPKRPVQTPQREWLRGPLREWCFECVESALQEFDQDWLDARAVWKVYDEFMSGHSDNSFYIWQWTSIGLMLKNSVGAHHV